jgi:nucleoid DNA-binding protein
MTESELVNRLALKTEYPKYKLKPLVRAVFEEMRLALSNGEEVTILNYVTFKIIRDPQRVKTDPFGRTKTYPSQNRLLVRAGHKMKQAVGQHVRKRGKYTEPYADRKGKPRGTTGEELGYELR